MRGGPAADCHGDPSWVGLELFAPSHCVSRRFERILKPKEVLVDVIKLHAWIKKFCKQCRRVTRKLQYVTKKTKLKLSLTEGGKEGKSKLVASNKYLESKRCGRSVWELISGTRPQSLERNESIKKTKGVHDNKC